LAFSDTLTIKPKRADAMKAAQFKEYGGPEVLELVEIDEPHAGPGEIRITVRAAGVNSMDWKVRSGQMREMMPLSLPAGSGLDAAGIVDEIGDGVDGIALGDAVLGIGTNTYAEHAVLGEWARKPDGLSFAEAAGFPVPVATAQRILDLVGVKAGQTVLISGAAGGVGSAAVQFALERGANVIGTASQANQSYLKDLGAIPTTYGEGLVKRVRDLAPGGVDAALDIAGSGVIPQLIELTGDPSKVVSIADFTAGDHGAQVSSDPGDRTAALAEGARLFEAGKLRIPVANSFTLKEASAAHEASETGHVAGRTVIVIN
jgi:NADPH:quinone reductase-like Zn-dependent oxidoreductase